MLHKDILIVVAKAIKKTVSYTLYAIMIGVMIIGLAIFVRDSKLSRLLAYGGYCHYVEMGQKESDDLIKQYIHETIFSEKPKDVVAEPVCEDSEK